MGDSHEKAQKSQNEVVAIKLPSHREELCLPMPKGLI